MLIAQVGYFLLELADPAGPPIGNADDAACCRHVADDGKAGDAMTELSAGEELDVFLRDDGLLRFGLTSYLICGEVSVVGSKAWRVTLSTPTWPFTEGSG